MPKLKRIEIPEAERARASWLLEVHWMLPDGNELCERRLVNRAREQLAEGCYYRFEWPVDTAQEEILEWVDFVHQVLEWRKGCYL